MAYINILAGSFQSCKARFDKNFITIPKIGKIALLDIQCYEVTDGDVIEIKLFDGRKMLIEKSDSFLKTIKTALYNEPENDEERTKLYHQRKIEDKIKTERKKKIKVIGVGVFVLFVVAMCSIPKKELTPEEQAEIAKVRAEKNAEEARKDKKREEFEKHQKITVISQYLVRNSLKDPDSAEFKNQDGQCGEVNSKNGFGGYTGFTRYIVVNENLIALEGENMKSSEFSKIWNKVCVKK